MPLCRKDLSRRRASALLVSILFVSLLVAFTTAQFAVVQSNLRQSSFFSSHAELHRYAESGIEVATHDIRHGISGDEGKIGTAEWSLAHDYGRDGYPGTYDEGEGDGLPTPGEPNLQPAAVGPAALGAGLIVYVTPVSANVQRIVATAATAEVMATVETFVEEVRVSLPRTGALYVPPTIALDLKGNSFLIDGNDHNVDGTPSGGDALPGITTGEGATPGDNAALLVSQIDSNHYDQVVGEGGEPSVGEVTGLDFDTVFDELKAGKTTDLAPGTHDTPLFGDASAGDFPITYTSGDLHLTGDGSGAGVLIIEGSLRITGEFVFTGLVVVRGDVILLGGGAAVHVYGSVMVGESLTAIDPDGEITVGGQADLLYSSAALDLVESNFEPSFSKVYYDDR